MIATSPISKIGVVALSIGAHALAGYLWLPDLSVDTRGGAEAVVEVRLGNSFADLSAGTLVPEAVEPPEVTAEDAQEVAEPQSPVEATPAEAPRQADAALPRSLPDAAHGMAQASRQTSKLAASANAPTRADMLSAAGALLAPARAVSAQTATAQPAEATSPAKASPGTSAPQADLVETSAPRLTGTELKPVETSPRPQARPDRRVTRAEPARTPPPTARGNAAQDARAGSASGTPQQSTQQASAAAPRATSAGNAAASNYPGLVNRRISRVRTPRVGSLGTAVVQFSVDAQGRLSALRVVQSSGSARLDEAALSVIRRAAPFPKPPPGAQRVFRKTIQSRG